MLKHQPKTLARTLAYIGFHSPGEFGLFWDPDATMPWKEFYWALQEDESLRFVRESHLKEIALLGIELPFTLNGNLLSLVPGVAVPRYPVAESVPERLHIGIRPKNLVSIQNIGLKPAARPLLAVCTGRDLALRIAKRREPEPILIEVLGIRALESGISFLVAGPGLYLVEAVPAQFLIIPRIREDLAERLAERKHKPAPKLAPQTPGSFFVRPDHLQSAAAPGEAPPGKAARREKGGWKKGSRKERHKRDL